MNAWLEQKELVMLFQAGALVGASIHEETAQDGYTVSFRGDCVDEDGNRTPKTKGGNQPFYSLKGQRDDYERVFKSLDAAASAVKRVGFREFHVHLCENKK